MTAKPIRVLFFDQTAVSRQRMQGAMRHPDLELVGAVGKEEQLARFLDRGVDVLVLGVAVLGDRPGASLDRLTRGRGDLPVVVLMDQRSAGEAEIRRHRAVAAMLPALTGDPGSQWVTGLVAACRPFRGRAAPCSPPSNVTPIGMRALPPAPTPSPRGCKVTMLAMGSSTCGPDALTVVVPQLPADFPVPVALVQHMPPKFTQRLAQQLDKLSPLEVLEAEEGMALKSGRLIIAPGGFHMQFKRNGVRVEVTLDEGPRVNSCRPAVDVMFRSAVQMYGGGVLGLVLTGMGADGLEGSRHIVASGGEVVVQDEATSVVWGMPGAVARAGLACAEVPLPIVPTAVSARCRAGTRKATG